MRGTMVRLAKIIVLKTVETPINKEKVPVKE
jgi:hypothetical protein